MSMTSFSIVVLAISLTILIVVYLADANHHKKRIIKLLRKRTGRNFEFQDRIRVTVYPWVGLNLGGVRVGNAQGFDDSYFAAIDKVKLRMKVSPLVKRRLHIDTIRLQGVRVNLVRRADGANNWDDLISIPAMEGESPQHPTTPESSNPAPGSTDARSSPKVEGSDRPKGPLGKQPGEVLKHLVGDEVGDEVGTTSHGGSSPPDLSPVDLASLNILGVDVRHLELVLKDAMTQSDYRFSVRTLRTSQIKLNKPIQVQARFALNTKNVNGLDSYIDVDTLASVHMRRSGQVT